MFAAEARGRGGSAEKNNGYTAETPSQRGMGDAEGETAPLPGERGSGDKG